MNNEELKGKVTIVTGASRGIGKSIALAFARSGAKLILASRNKYSDLTRWLARLGELEHQFLLYQHT